MQAPVPPSVGRDAQLMSQATLQGNTAKRCHVWERSVENLVKRGRSFRFRELARKRERGPRAPSRCQKVVVNASATWLLTSEDIPKAPFFTEPRAANANDIAMAVITTQSTVVAPSSERENLRRIRRMWYLPLLGAGSCQAGNAIAGLGQRCPECLRMLARRGGMMLPPHQRLRSG